ncbi:MAG: hypothetical protein NTZ61_00915, partial [Proteobacteria bacterium]|nr:hypothetical protein [Pseudomonadota bacterium]
MRIDSHGPNKSRSRRPGWAGLAAFVLCGLAGFAVPVLAGQEVTIEGVVHVQNGATPSQGTQTLKLEKLWSAGGASDEETLFGLITQVQVDDQGNVYLLDTQLSDVKVLSAAGAPLKTLSRQGEGPGEVRTPIDMLFMPDGTIGLVQAFPGRIVQIDRDGNPAGTFSIGGDDPTQGGFVVLLDTRARGGELVIAGMQISMKPDQSGQSRTRFLSSYTMDGKEKVRYVERKSELDLKNLKIIEGDEYFVFPRRWALDSAGRVYAATARDRYQINVYNTDGSLARVIEREYARPKRNAQETARIQAAMDAQTRQVPVKIETQIEEYEPVIARIQIMDNCEIWVMNSASTRDLPAGVMINFDVFDPAGNFVRAVAVACDANGDQDGLFFFGKDRALVVTGLA